MQHVKTEKLRAEMVNSDGLNKEISGGRASSQSFAAQTPVIEVKNLNKYYGAFHAVKDASFNVNSGEIIVICGPSGSGKSTLIRCINYLEKFNSGVIRVNNIELTHEAKAVAEVRRQLGMVFQGFNLFPHLTVLQNCTFALRLAQKASKVEAEQIAREYLALVKVDNQADKYPSALSGGQQQRVAIARALCLKPKVMLFDEPTSALDPESVGSVLRIMEGLASTGITMVCVTHELGFARKVADRCIFMEQGEIIAQAPTDEFFEDSKNERLRGFLSQIIH